MEAELKFETSAESEAELLQQIDEAQKAADEIAKQDALRATAQKLHDLQTQLDMNKLGAQADAQAAVIKPQLVAKLDALYAEAEEIRTERDALMQASEALAGKLRTYNAHYQQLSSALGGLALEPIARAGIPRSLLAKHMAEFRAIWGEAVASRRLITFTDQLRHADVTLEEVLLKLAHLSGMPWC